MNKGEVLSELQFYTVEEVLGNGDVNVKSDKGQSITLSKQYADKMLNSASDFTETEKVTRTELIEKFLSSPRVAMTVNFDKKVDEKSVLENIVNLYPNRGGKLVSEADFKKKVKSALNLKGENRTMVGRHYGGVDNNGRVSFIDMSLVIDTSKTYDPRQRLVDPRTINWLIVDGTKYQVK